MTSVIPLEAEGALAPVVSANHALDRLFDVGNAPALAEIKRARESESTDLLSERVLRRLIQSETHEVNPHFRDDYRIAFLIVTHCERGDAVECSPEVLATYEVLGCHPTQVYSRILARREAMLGPAGADAHVLTSQSAPVPKKPSNSIPALIQREEA